MSKLSQAIKSGGLVVTAEVTPPTGADPERLVALGRSLKDRVHAVVVEENRDGVRLSSVVAGTHLKSAGAEAVVTMLTRDTNRIGLQSMFLGAVSLGITDILVLSGYHQALTSEKQARGVYDIDSVQAIGLFRAMRDDGLLSGDQQARGVVLGGSANPFAGPIDLRAMRVEKKVKAGADFIITNPVFDVSRFREWFQLLKGKGVPEKACLIAGIMWLASADEAKKLNETYRGMNIPDAVIARLSQAADPEQEGLRLAAEAAEEVKHLEGVRGLHFWARGREEAIPRLLKAARISIL
jgi:methylenetetrahydrofolate reductase (NADPH)